MVRISEKVSRTFAEYRFLPGLTAKGPTPHSIDLSTPITASGRERAALYLKIPLISAAMQSVTGPDLAVALAQQGGLGVLFCSQPIESEAMMVKAVKRARAGFVSQLEVANGEDSVGSVADLIARTGYNTIPIVGGTRQDYGLLLGMVEGPIPDEIPRNMPVKEYMRTFMRRQLDDIVADAMRSGNSTEVIRTVKDFIHFGETGISLEEANEVMEDNRTKYIPVVNPDGTLKFMVFSKDAQAHQDFPNAVVDSNKRYMIGAAVNTHDHEKRVPALVEAGVDVLFIDASDGFTEYQQDCIRFIKNNFSSVPVIAGNIITDDAFNYLAGSGIDGIKVGMGGGSICITQEQKGTGRGQATATQEVAIARDAYFKKNGIYIPLIADGGISTAKDIAMALAFGADVVMMGRFFAGCHETPNPLKEEGGERYKEYWGEGSARAKEWLQKRYGQNEFEEGIVARVPYTGRVSDILVETFAKIRATMVSVGAKDIRELQERALVELISDASRIEGGVHDVIQLGSGK